MIVLKTVDKSIPVNIKSEKKAVLVFLILTFTLIIGITGGLIYFVKSSRGPSPESLMLKGDLTSNVSEGSDKQVISLAAKGGFTPLTTVAKANKATLLKLETKNTFDCSSTLSIPGLGVQKNLPPTGSTTVDIPAQKPGTRLDGTCSMGMYSFSVNFVE